MVVPYSCTTDRRKGESSGVHSSHERIPHLGTGIEARANLSSDHGGWLVRNRLHLPLTREHDGRTYVCKAENPVLKRGASSGITLDVHCKDPSAVSSAPCPNEQSL